MRLSTLLLGAGALRGVYGFRDTSPFFYFSTADHDFKPSPPQIITADSLLQITKGPLAKCASDAYLLVSQPAVNSVDYSVADAAPRLRRSMLGGEGEAGIKTSFGSSDVLGEMNLDEIEAFLHETCKAEVMNVDASTGSFQTVDDMKPRVVRVDFPSLPSAQPERGHLLRENDAFLSSIIDMLPSTKYTVLYITSPLAASSARSGHSGAAPSKNIASPNAAHYELKREVRPEDDDDNQPDIEYVDGPLFARYQFLSPGLFMGLLVGFLLLSILGVGFRALGSLQVSYGAFEKEMGPAAQKKQQ